MLQREALTIWLPELHWTPPGDSPWQEIIELIGASTRPHRLVGKYID